MTKHTGENEKVQQLPDGKYRTENVKDTVLKWELIILQVTSKDVFRSKGIFFKKHRNILTLEGQDPNELIIFRILKNT